MIKLLINKIKDSLNLRFDEALQRTYTDEFSNVCHYDGLDKVKDYVLNKKVDMHYLEDQAFKKACHRQDDEVLKYLIMEAGLKKTPIIEECLKHEPYKKAQKYFNLIELNGKLNSTLNSTSQAGIQKRKL